MSSICALMCRFFEKIICVPKKVGNEDKLRFSFVFLVLKISVHAIFCVVFGLFAFGVIENLDHECLVQQSFNTPCQYDCGPSECPLVYQKNDEGQPYCGNDETNTLNYVWS